jgi:hypothetical protein
MIDTVQHGVEQWLMLWVVDVCPIVYCGLLLDGVRGSSRGEGTMAMESNTPSQGVRDSNMLLLFVLSEASILLNWIIWNVQLAQAYRHPSCRAFDQSSVRYRSYRKLLAF